MESKAEDGKPVFSECELLLVRFEWGGGGAVLAWHGEWISLPLIA